MTRHARGAAAMADDPWPPPRLFVAECANINGPMKRTELMTELIRVRAALRAEIDDLGEKHMLTPGVEGRWSVRDVLAHLTAWEVDMLTNLGKVRRGAKPGTVQWTQAAIEKQNVIWHAEMKDRPLRSVLADFDGVRKQTLRVLEGLSDQETAQPSAWLHGRSLIDYIAEMTANHERKHLEHLRQWRSGKTSGPDTGSEPNGAGPQAA